MGDRNTGDHIKDIYSRLSDITDRLDDITRAILGDNTFGSWGYRQRIENAEDRIDEVAKHVDKIDKRFEKIYHRVIGISIGVTIAASSLGWLIHNVVSSPAKANPIKDLKTVEIPKASKGFDPRQVLYDIESLRDDTVNVDTGVDDETGL